MRDRLAEFGDAIVVVIAFGTLERAADYRHRRLAPLTVLVDPSRGVYAAYGLARGSLWVTWGPRVWRAYAKLIAHGARPHHPTEDTRQLGGDFVVGRDGRIVYAFRSDNPDDRPAVDELLAAVRSG